MKFNIAPVTMINTDIKIRVLKHLLHHAAPMSEREIASVVHVSHMSVNRTLKELAGYNLVSFSRTGTAHLWRVNKLSYSFKALSGIIENMSKLELPMNDLKRTVKAAFPEGLVQRAVIFGSVAGGTESEGSDIDLFILVKNDVDKERAKLKAEELSLKCLDRYGNKLSAYILTRKEESETKNSNIVEEANKGIILI